MRNLAMLLYVLLSASAFAQSRTTTITPGPAYASKAITLDGTQPYMVTPTPDGKTTVTQGSHVASFAQLSFAARTVGTWPTCPSKPPVASRTVQCPAGTTGTWTQTQDFASAPYPQCWTVLPWAPTSAPAGACTPVAPPPPSGSIDLSYVDKTSAAYATYKNWVDANLNRTDGYLFLATDAATMAKLDGGAQYCAKAISLADTYATRVNSAIAAGGQPNWGADSNGSDGISSDSYLNVGTHLRDFALAMKWCSPTPAQVAAWTAISTQAVYNVWHASQAQWGGRSYPWSGWSTTDPGDNYFYSFTLATTMYQWMTGDGQYASRTWPLAAAYFAALSTGGSEEGMGYGTSHKGLFEDIRIERDLFGLNYTDAHLTNSIYYWLHATTPDFLHFAAIGDQSRVSNPTWFDYQRALVAQAMLLTPDASARAQGSWLLHHVTPQTMQYSFDYRDGLLPVGDGGAAPSALSYFASSTGDLFARTSWTDPNALWLAFRAGKYDQSHAHQDQGAVQLYTRGSWLVVDQSVWSHSGIQQGVTNNSTLRFERNGVASPQVYNSTSSMTVTGNDPAQGMHALANLQPAAGAAVSAWTRTVDFVGRTVTITDAFAPNAGYAAIWQLQVPVQPVVSGNVVTAGALRATVLQPAGATISIVNMHSVDSDYNTGWRIEVTGGAAAYKVQLDAP
jgi:hypothetical protein